MQTAEYPNWLIESVCQQYGIKLPATPKELTSLLAENKDISRALVLANNILHAFQDTPPVDHSFLVSMLLRFAKPLSVEEALRQLIAECVDADGSTLRPSLEAIRNAQSALAALDLQKHVEEPV